MIVMYTKRWMVVDVEERGGGKGWQAIYMS